jgi:RNA polymerase sigma-70 factor (ECF subfamily)
LPSEPYASGSAELDFDRFYVQTGHRSLALAYALTGDWGDAEDLVQDAYAALYRRWAVVSRYEDPAGWVRHVITNRSASRWRRLAREARALARLGTRREEGHDAPSSDPAFWSVVHSLPQQQRAVVALFYVMDLPVSEIASRLGCSEGTVKSHLSRARAALHSAATGDDEGRGAE